MKNYSVALMLFVGIGIIGMSLSTKKDSPLIDKEKLVERHNYYRDLVGVPPLQWSDQLAAVAQNWANRLARSCHMYHSESAYGENIYWTSGSASPRQVVDSWGSEKSKYNHKNPVYKRNVGRKTGHYSQIIWRKTTHVGGAMQKCKHGGEIWVCNYDPAGNVIGERAF